MGAVRNRRRSFSLHLPPLLVVFIATLQMNPNSIPLFRDTFMINGVRTMGPLKMPYRARCLEGDGSKPCQCLWFMSPPSSAANKVTFHRIVLFCVLTYLQFACSKCGHGIHSHVDYVSKIVHHCSASHCAAYVQEVLSPHQTLQMVLMLRIL